MRKWLLIGCISICLLSPVAHAHIVGVFGDFLAGVQNESSSESLRQEIEETREQIAYLAPQAKRYEAQYQASEEIAIAKLRFYSTIGLDTLMDFVLKSNSVTDALANQRIVEQNIESYMQELHRLYLDYMQLHVTQEALQSHEQLLRVIEANLQAREIFTAKHRDPALSDPENEQKISELIADIWVNEAYDLDDILLEDARWVKANLPKLFTQQTVDSPYRMSESTLNETTRVDYHLRSDHIYVHHNQGSADVILIGTIAKTGNRIAKLSFEAGYINGFPISSRIMSKLEGFEIDYSLINPDSKDFYVEQANGAILIQAMEQAND